MADLGHAPPLHHYIEDVEKGGGRSSSGKTGNNSPPNLLALTQYYTERKVIRRDATVKVNPVAKIKTIKGTSANRSTPAEGLLGGNDNKILYRNEVPSGSNINRPRKLAPISPTNHKTLAMAVEESHHRFLGGYNSNYLTVKPSRMGVSNLEKRAGAKRGGAGYAAAASRALKSSSNDSTPMTPENSPQGSSQTLEQMGYSNSDFNTNQEHDSLFSSADLKKHKILVTPLGSPTHTLQRKDTFSLENPSTYVIPSTNKQPLRAIVSQNI